MAQKRTWKLRKDPLRYRSRLTRGEGCDAATEARSSRLCVARGTTKRTPFDRFTVSGLASPVSACRAKEAWWRRTKVEQHRGSRSASERLLRPSNRTTAGDFNACRAATQLPRGVLHNVDSALGNQRAGT